MSLLKRLGMGRSDPPPQNRLMAAVREHLDALPAERAEFVTAFAGLLVRVAHADLEVSEAERAALHDVIAAHAGLAPAESQAVADVVVHQATVLGGINYASLTRTVNELGTETDKEHVIDCLYAIATADDTISVIEDEEIRQVARALLLTHAQFIAVRSRYKERLEVIQALRKARG
jgi:uncharacterized tellurite resistance protein B-like protein